MSLQTANFPTAPLLPMRATRTGPSNSSLLPIVAAGTCGVPRSGPAAHFRRTPNKERRYRLRHGLDIDLARECQRDALAERRLAALARRHSVERFAQQTLPAREPSAPQAGGGSLGECRQQGPRTTLAGLEQDLRKQGFRVIKSKALRRREQSGASQEAVGMHVTFSDRNHSSAAQRKARTDQVTAHARPGMGDRARIENPMKNPKGPTCMGMPPRRCDFFEEPPGSEPLVAANIRRERMIFAFADWMASRLSARELEGLRAFGSRGQHPDAWRNELAMRGQTLAGREKEEFLVRDAELDRLSEEVHALTVAANPAREAGYLGQMREDVAAHPDVTYYSAMGVGHTDALEKAILEEDAACIMVATPPDSIV
jgi:hypothetical protein